MTINLSILDFKSPNGVACVCVMRSINLSILDFKSTTAGERSSLNDYKSIHIGF